MSMECPECNGMGARTYPGTPLGHTETCRKCNGTREHGMISRESSLQFVAFKVSQTKADTTPIGDRMMLDAIEWMRDHGSSLTLNWGEDNDCWEVSWISSGDRFTGVHQNLRFAMVEALTKAFRKRAS